MDKFVQKGMISRERERKNTVYLCGYESKVLIFPDVGKQRKCFYVGVLAERKEKASAELRR